MRRLLLLAVVAAAGSLPSAPANASCLPQCLLAVTRCAVDLGYCAGDCTVNVGYCAPGGQCKVNVGYCDDNTKLPVGV